MRCKQGDDAIIVWSLCPANIGKVVRVVAAHGMRRWQGAGSGETFCWVVTRLDGGVLVGQDEATGQRAESHHLIISDTCLQPLRRAKAPSKPEERCAPRSS